MGVPHTVILVDDYAHYALDRLGHAIVYSLDIFPRQANVILIRVVDDENLMIMTRARVASRPLGCGTVCCSSAVIAHKLGSIKGKCVKLTTAGGEVFVTFANASNVIMVGSAETNCTGVFSR